AQAADAQTGSGNEIAPIGQRPMPGGRIPERRQPGHVPMDEARIEIEVAVDRESSAPTITDGDRDVGKRMEDRKDKAPRGNQYLPGPGKNRDRVRQVVQDETRGN